jgi:hypothetical protein
MLFQNERAYREAKYIPGFIKGRFPITIKTSTRKFAFGLMQQEIDEAPKAKEKILQWNIIDVTERCPEERHKECIVSVFNNKYIDIAEGKYIFFFCDDDILLPNCLEEHYKFAESHGECDTHSGQMWLNYKDGVWTWKELHQYLCEFNMGNSPSCKLTGGAVMFRKDHIVSLGQPYFRQLNPQHCSTADALFFEDLSKKYRIFAVGMTLSIARFHE